MTDRLTITEALAELKTIDKRIEKKRAFINQYIARQDIVKDPLERDGGSAKAIVAAIQAIHDLEARKILIRHAIASKNMETSLTVSGETRRVDAWLIWRREVAPAHQAHLQALNAAILNLRQQTMKRGGTVFTEPGPAQKQEDVVVNVNELGLANEIEHMEEVLGNLDGLLSLTNATTFIEV